MKAATLGLAASLTFSSMMAWGQGVLYFSNSGFGLDAPVTNWDGARLPVPGHNFTADLRVAPGVVSDPNLLSSCATTAFVTNGYFAGGVIGIPGARAGTIVTVQVVAFDPCYLEWCDFFQVGASDLFQVTLAEVPNPPATLKGLRPFGVTPPTTYSAPSLTLNTLADNRLLFAWLPSAVGTNFLLQQNADLRTTNWVTVGEMPVLVGPRFQIAVPKPSGTMFYRLVQ